MRRASRDRWRLPPMVGENPWNRRANSRRNQRAKTRGINGPKPVESAPATTGSQPIGQIMPTKARVRRIDPKSAMAHVRLTLGWAPSAVKASCARERQASSGISTEIASCTHTSHRGRPATCQLVDGRHLRKNCEPTRAATGAPLGELPGVIRAARSTGVGEVTRNRNRPKSSSSAITARPDMWSGDLTPPGMPSRPSGTT
jgi:hypothetical protein